MNINEIARKIISERKKLACTNTPATLQSVLGPDGFTEALRRGWLYIDFDMGGMVGVTNDHSMLAKINEIADTLKVGDAVAVTENGQSFQGKVMAIKQDGTYTLAFEGDKRPSKIDFKREEIAFTPQANTTTTPPSYPRYSPMTSPSTSSTPYVGH